MSRLRWIREFSPARLIFPPVCQSCDVALTLGEHGEMPFLCHDCASKIVKVGERCCHLCGHIFDGPALSTLQCSNCRDRELGFDFSVSPYRSQGVLRDLMHHFKYSRQIHLARLFGKCLASVWEDSRLTGGKWTVVPVPLHWRRYRERHFNQAREISKFFVKHSPAEIDLEMVPLLKRVRYTVRQAQLDRELRLKNLQSAFEVPQRRRKEQYRGGRFLVVDDVLTTGSTASECASVLRQHFEPEEIVAISVLRG